MAEAAWPRQRATADQVFRGSLAVAVVLTVVVLWAALSGRSALVL